MKNSFHKTINCLIVTNIIGTLPAPTSYAQDFNLPSNIQIADPSFNIQGEIDLLLRASLFYELLSVGQINLGKNKPILQKNFTRLGYIGTCIYFWKK